MDRAPEPRPGWVAASPRAGFTAVELAAAAGASVLREGRARILGAAVDSRRVEPGNAFFALPGEQTDGHRYLEAAAAAGAAALIVSTAPGQDRLDGLHGPDGACSILRVPDTILALQSAAAAYRDRFDPLVVGITGSLAKTSTKELAAEVLAGRFHVLRSLGNENNEIGLPLTLLRLLPTHEAAVLEMGLYRPGEIALLARLARPTIGVVTAVRGVHLSRAGSIEAIEAGKAELVEALPASGWAILNADDARVVAMAARTPARVLRYGFDLAADVHAEDVRSLGVRGMAFRLRLPAGSVAVTMPTLGRHGVHNALAAAAVGVCAGLDAAAIAARLALPAPAPHRSQLVTAGPWTILDDSYNASPDAVLAALGLLAELPGRHIAVLGEMLELGDTAAAEHLRVGRGAAALVDRLIVVGAGAAGIAEGAVAGGLPAAHVEQAATRDEALAMLLARLRDGDTVLVKASRGAELDRLVERLVLAAGGTEATA
jgi:UDP-N-acetylmuramoyl-tripeptide--D-alanyl-D-alanine ligase